MCCLKALFYLFIPKSLFCPSIRLLDRYGMPVISGAMGCWLSDYSTTFLESTKSTSFLLKGNCPLEGALAPYFFVYCSLILCIPLYAICYRTFKKILQTLLLIRNKQLYRKAFPWISINEHEYSPMCSWWSCTSWSVAISHRAEFSFYRLTSDKLKPWKTCLAKILWAPLKKLVTWSHPFSQINKWTLTNLLIISFCSSQFFPNLRYFDSQFLVELWKMNVI